MDCGAVVRFIEQAAVTRAKVHISLRSSECRPQAFGGAVEQFSTNWRRALADRSPE